MEAIANDHADDTVEEGLSIGALSRATGISIHSLRMWERRYGSPNSVRRDSGHRRYPQEEVPRLRAVARALASGLRAGTVVTASVDQIDRMMEASRRSPVETNTAVQNRLAALMAAARGYDEPRLGAMLEADWATLGPLRFLEDRAVPLMRQMGEEWQCGHLRVAQEHFASERLGDFLAGKWRALNRDAAGAPFVLATLPRDEHRMGLQMAAVATTVARRRVVFLGSGVPVEEIADSARIVGAGAICLGISSATPPRIAIAAARQLAALLPADTRLVCGGAGAAHVSIPGVMTFRDVGPYAAWVASGG